MTDMQESTRAEEAVAGLMVRHGLTLATAESLTGGLVGELVTSVPGASKFYVGGMITYATRAKRDVLGVDPSMLTTYGPVSPQTAAEMASRVRDAFAADIGVSTTGVAGPDEQDGHPVGTLHIGVCDASGVNTFALRGPQGGRAEIRLWAARAALRTVVERLRELDRSRSAS